MACVFVGERVGHTEALLACTSVPDGLTLVVGWLDGVFLAEPQPLASALNGLLETGVTVRTELLTLNNVRRPTKQGSGVRLGSHLSGPFRASLQPAPHCSRSRTTNSHSHTHFHLHTLAALIVCCEAYPNPSQTNTSMALTLQQPLPLVRACCPARAGRSPS